MLSFKVEDYSRDPDQKRRATHDPGVDAPKKKMKVIDIKPESTEKTTDLKKSGTLSIVPDIRTGQKTNNEMTIIGPVFLLFQSHQ